MRNSIIIFVCLLLTACQASMAARDCEEIGYQRGTPDFTSCAEKQLVGRKENIREHFKQQAKIQTSKSASGIFGRTPICDTKKNADGSALQECY